MLHNAIVLLLAALIGVELFVVIDALGPWEVFEWEYVLLVGPFVPAFFELGYFGRVGLREVILFEGIGAEVDEFPVFLAVATYEFPSVGDAGARGLVLEI